MPESIMSQPAVAILVGTRKGLFIARSDASRRNFEIEGPHLAGYEIQRAFLDSRDGGRTGYAAAHHPIWGIHVYRTENAGQDWHPLADVPRHGEDDGPENLKVIWNLAQGPAGQPDTIYAGIVPPGIFVSHDRGEHWTCLNAFHQHPSSKYWHPAKGGCAVHSLAAADQRLYAALAAGAYIDPTTAGRASGPATEACARPYLPGAEPEAGHNDHT